jgi:hypothetical protein
MQEAFGIVIFVVVGVGVLLAVVSLFHRGRLYDEIGHGGLSINEDRAPRPAPGAPVDIAERDAEVRQMLTARNARAAARGEREVDVEEELLRLTAPVADPGLRDEVRDMVVARNARREARGEQPLDVEAEVDRQLRELGA